MDTGDPHSLSQGEGQISQPLNDVEEKEQNELVEKELLKRYIVEELDGMDVSMLREALLKLKELKAPAFYRSCTSQTTSTALLSTEHDPSSAMIVKEAYRSPSVHLNRKNAHDVTVVSDRKHNIKPAVSSFVTGIEPEVNHKIYAEKNLGIGAETMKEEEERKEEAGGKGQNAEERDEEEVSENRHYVEERDHLDEGWEEESEESNEEWEHLPREQSDLTSSYEQQKEEKKEEEPCTPQSCTEPVITYATDNSTVFPSSTTSFYGLEDADSCSRSHDQNPTPCPLCSCREDPLYEHIKRFLETDLHSILPVHQGYHHEQKRWKQFRKQLKKIILTSSRDSIEKYFFPYQISHNRKRGLVLIIVNIKFDRLNKRLCGADDLERMEAYWISRGYRVRVEENLTADGIVKVMDEVRKVGDPRKTVQHGDDSFFCCISSHGGWDPEKGVDVVLGTDGYPVLEGPQSERQLVRIVGGVDFKALCYEKLSNRSDGCPILGEYPKVIIVQACRGNGEIVASGKRQISEKPPPEADFLLAYSTSLGTKSYRADDYSDGYLPGSLYITYLFEIFESLDCIFPLQYMLSLVCNVMASLRKSIKCETELVKQTPSHTSKLRGPLFLRREAQKHYKHAFLIPVQKELRLSISKSQQHS